MNSRVTELSPNNAKIKRLSPRKPVLTCKESLPKKKDFKEDTALHGKNHVSGKVFFCVF